jgi:hypothetical protein
VRRLKADGHELIVSSGRANRLVHDEVDRAFAVKQMEFALQRYAIPCDRVDYGNEGKVIADLYVDDRSLGAPVALWQGCYVIDWPLAYTMINDLAARRRHRLSR